MNHFMFWRVGVATVMWAPGKLASEQTLVRQPLSNSARIKLLIDVTIARSSHA
jgi:hypothetical protein